MSHPDLQHGIFAIAGRGIFASDEDGFGVYAGLTEPVDYIVALDAAFGVGRDVAFALRWRDVDRLAWDLNLYSGMGLFGKNGDRSTLDKRNLLRRWQRQGVGGAFLEAARQGEKGILSPKLARHLARVRFVPGGGADVEDFLALAAWALLGAVMRGGYSVRNCELCGLPFLASPRAHYCKRRAPGSQEQNCQQYAKVRDHRARKKEAKRG